MTDAEQELVRSLTRGAWPLGWQAVLAVVAVAGYWLWSRAYYRVVDPGMRRRVGRALGAAVVWVPRHTAEYQTPIESGFTRGRRWTWGIAAERERTATARRRRARALRPRRHLAAGLWPVAVTLYLTLWRYPLSALLLIPVLTAVIAIYSVFWTGRYEVRGMREEG
jgi:hypothetical protein